jgi:hypothetical protein
MGSPKKPIAQAMDSEERRQALLLPIDRENAEETRSSTTGYILRNARSRLHGPPPAAEK